MKDEITYIKSDERSNSDDSREQREMVKMTPKRIWIEHHSSEYAHQKEPFERFTKVNRMSRVQFSVFYVQEHALEDVCEVAYQDRYRISCEGANGVQ